MKKVIVQTPRLKVKPRETTIEGDLYDLVDSDREVLKF